MSLAAEAQIEQDSYFEHIDLASRNGTFTLGTVNRGSHEIYFLDYPVSAVGRV